MGSTLSGRYIRTPAFRQLMSQTSKCRKQLCSKGHDTVICGRNVSNGRCLSCQKNAQWKNYGIKRNGVYFTVEDYNYFFRVQKECCKLCGKHQSNLNMTLAVDHDHSTGEFRGLLCQKCNVDIAVYEKIKETAKIYLGDN